MYFDILRTGSNDHAIDDQKDGCCNDNRDQLLDHNGEWLKVD